MKIMVSACLTGENCKYNGGNNLNEKVMALMKGNMQCADSLAGSVPGGSGSGESAENEVSGSAGNKVITICPEVMGGLPTPRTPSEIQDGVVVNRAGICVDREFRLGAQKCLEIAQREQPDLIVLQSRSPSCGVRQRYDGTFSGRLIDAPGVTAQLLIENGFRVVDVEELIENGFRAVGLEE